MLFDSRIGMTLLKDLAATVTVAFLIMGLLGIWLMGGGGQLAAEQSEYLARSQAFALFEQHLEDKSRMYEKVLIRYGARLSNIADQCSAILAGVGKPAGLKSGAASDFRGKTDRLPDASAMEGRWVMHSNFDQDIRPRILVEQAFTAVGSTVFAARRALPRASAVWALICEPSGPGTLDNFLLIVSSPRSSEQSASSFLETHGRRELDAMLPAVNPGLAPRCFLHRLGDSMNLRLTMMLPIRHASGQFAGIAGVDIRFEQLVTDIEKMNRRGAGMAAEPFLLDDQGKLAYVSGTLREFLGMGVSGVGTNRMGGASETDFTGQPGRSHGGVMPRSVGDRDSGSVELPAGRFILFTQKMPMTGWSLGMSIPEQVLFTTIQSFRQAMASTQPLLPRHVLIAALASSAVALALLMVIISRRVLGPVRQLMQVMQRHSSWEPPTAVTSSPRKDEFALLAEAYDAMLVAVNQKQLRLDLAERRYTDIFENAREGFFQVSIGGRFITANPALLRLLGYPGVESLSAEARSALLQCVQDKDDARALLEKVRKDGLVLDFEAIFLRRDKSGFWGSLNVRGVRGGDGSIRFYEGSLLDISARKERDACRHRAEVSLARNRAKTQLLAMMSHELRTACQPIVGFPPLIMSAGREDLPQRCLATIKQAGERLSTFLDDILDYSTIESGGVRLSKDTFHLRKLLHDAVSDFQGPDERDRPPPTINLDRTVPEWATGDARRLRQILRSLLDNARKIDVKGRVAVRAWRETTAGEDEGLIRLRVSVSDSGPGIPVEQQAGIFEPLQQADQSLRRSHGGLGLGLAISKQLAMIMGGDIHLESAPGKGSTFTFEVHLGERGWPEAKPGEPPSAPALGPDNRRLRVLLVEDNPMNVEFMRALFQMLDHELIVTDTGAQAILTLARTPVDVILMDVDLPGMDGMEATRRIRSGHAGGLAAITPILGISAHAVDSVREECLVSGMNAFLTKPVGIEPLLNALRAGLGREIPLGTMRGAKAPPARPALAKPGGDPQDREAEVFQNKMQELFEQSVTREIAELGEALARGDLPGVACKAHAISNSALMAEPGYLATLSLMVETRAKSGDLHGATEFFRAMEALDLSAYVITGFWSGKVRR